MADIEKVKKGFKCCSAAKADSVCFESECPYKNHDERSEKCCIDEMLDNGLEAIEQLEKTVEDQAERIAIMEAEMPGWISVDEKLPDNAKHKGAFCPRYRVLTKWGETVGWYNPDKGWWYFLLWYTYGVGVDFEHGDDPKLAHEKNGAKVVTHWMPMQELQKEGAADE